MQITFEPRYKITEKIMRALMRIEAAREKAPLLPLTPIVLASLRESARLITTHYSTMIEGNRLDAAQIKEVVKHDGHFPGKERDAREVKGYYAALTAIEQWTARQEPITQKLIQTIHALVMADGRTKVVPGNYRDGQNVIRDAKTNAIIYLPPEASDVPSLMTAFVDWINKNKETPCPIVASIAHYQFATIHPYYDGNGRTARLLTTLVLHEGGYDLKGLYSLEEYYARNLGAYYAAISIGDSHNYYMGRADAEITKWIEYFVEGMAYSFDQVIKRMEQAQADGFHDKSPILRKLDPRQRRALELFQEYEVVTARQIGELFGFRPRTAASLCKKWVDSGFLLIVDASNRGRSYRLSPVFS